MSDTQNNSVDSSLKTRLIPVWLRDSAPHLQKVDANDPAVEFYDVGATASVRLFTEVLQLSQDLTMTKKYGIGSGAVVSSDGLILTCDHVIKDGQNLTAELITGERLKAIPVAHFPEHDLALVKVDKSALNYLKMGTSAKLKFGQGTAIFGHPSGSQNVFVSVGEIRETGPVKGVMGASSPISAMSDSEKVFRLSSYAEPGSSGAPVVNNKGDVIGVIFGGSVITKNGKAVTEWTCAVPIDTLKKSLKSRPDLYKKLHWH